MRKNRVGQKKNGFSMFILDDDKNMTDALEAYFAAAGYDTEQSNDPLDALDRLREKSFDILLLDFIMYPVCGDEVVARLREFDRRIYVIMLTGHREVAPPLNTIHELDIQGYFEKSDRFDQLELLVESCIKSIQQMKMIFRYQEGLSQILEAVPKLNRFRPLEEFFTQVLRQLRILTGSRNTFAWFSLGDILPEENSQNLPRDTFRGTGIWEGMSLEEFLEKYPHMKICMKRREISFHQDGDRRIILLPLKAGKEMKFGMLGVVETGESRIKQDLLAVFSEQVASALHNSVLHILLELNSSQIRQAYSRLEESYVETIEVLRLMVDAKDIYTRGHSDRVSYYAEKLARALGKPEEFVQRVRVGGLLHDIGKIGIPDDVLQKPSRLTAEEFARIKEHPVRGADTLERISMLKELAPIVRSHHERFDGTGYPDGLKGEEIPEEARIISIADAFDAMTSDRQYRKKLSRREWTLELKKGSNRQFDGRMTAVFLRYLDAHFDEMQEELSWTYEAGGL